MPSDGAGCPLGARHPFAHFFSLQVMSLEDPQAIDQVDTPEPGRVRLVVVESGQTTDAAARLSALLAKLHTYVNYALSDEFAQRYPSVPLSGVSIRVVCASPPTAEMAQIHEVGPQADRQRKIAVEYVDAQQALRESTAAEQGPRRSRPSTAPLDERLKLTPALLQKLRWVMFGLWGIAGVVFIAWLIELNTERRLRSQGVVVSAEVLSAALLAAAEGRRTFYRLPVRWDARTADGEYVEVEKTFHVKEETYEDARLNGTVDVKYLPADIRVSSIVSEMAIPINHLVTASELAALAAVMWFVLWRMGKRLPREPDAATA